VDKNQLQRAIINLVVNSIDAIEKKESGRIEIRTAVEENKNLIISINDNGCGIDSNQKNKIFYLFYTTKGSGGNGLGLPVVKKFVESLDGKLQVESNPGIGTTVSMIFPTITDLTVMKKPHGASLPKVS
jgi:two-component system sensor histidine kinase AtoS